MNIICHSSLLSTPKDDSNNCKHIIGGISKRTVIIKEVKHAP